MIEEILSNPESIVYSHHFKSIEKPIYTEFHCHSNFELFFFVSGSVRYIINKYAYDLESNDLLIINSNELHKPTFLTSPEYERIIVQFDPEPLRLLSTKPGNLISCFLNKNSEYSNLLRLEKPALDKVKAIFKKFEELDENVNYNNSLKLAYLIELLVIVNNEYYSKRSHIFNETNFPKVITDIIEYINFNYETDLSLEIISENFKINKSHICRLFKKHVGITLHNFILYKRISIAKTILENGSSVTDACFQSGFNDYSNFIRIFTKLTGTSPGKFKSH